jgi:branched-chain amino acid aminotransferase
MSTEFAVTSAQPTPVAEREKQLDDPGFGEVFTDHMVSIVWDVETGWQTPELLPYGPIPIDPASAVLHYAQEVFEGLKAYRHSDGSIVVFRPEANAARLNRSAKRLALPELPAELFLAGVHKLVEVDKDWVPGGENQSLYIRPFMIADENFLGVRAAHRARFMIIASPAGAYFSGGVHPVSIWLSRGLSRAGQGGTGDAKCGGNYAASLLPQEVAAQHNCEQVLFTDSSDNDRIDELGGMNLFLVHRDNILITPELNGNILPGITRDSLIQLAKDHGMDVQERPVTVSEWQNGVKSGEITEAFACGTAAVITPISSIQDETGKLVDFGENAYGEVTRSLRNELTDIQLGKREDPHDWIDVVVPARS